MNAYGNTPVVPEPGTLCGVVGCEAVAIRTWVVPVTDDRGLPLWPREVDYCGKHTPNR